MDSGAGMAGAFNLLVIFAIAGIISLFGVFGFGLYKVVSWIF
jgi:hypothetical protein